ncbi:MAG: flagellar basal body P-ring formation protein FlgA [Deltaproteobacteria bacterium]|nr:flagellar basal body P-ring formation protein FlgA [Deltaproteobacteria bacterium]
MISGKLLIAFGVLVAAIATLTSALAQTSLPQIDREIKLRDKTEVWSQAVCLGNLVDDGWVQSRCSVDKGMCCRWSLKGENTRIFSRAELQRELSKVNFGGFNLIVKGADEIAVTQTRRELSVAEIQAKVISTAAAKFGEEGAGAGVTSLKLQSPIYVSLDDESAWDVILPEPLLEHAAVRVVSTSEGSQALGWAQVTLKLEGEVYVARKQVHPNDLLDAKDFEIRKINVLAAQSTGQTLFRKGQFPEATRAKLTIQSGSALTAAVVERIPSVHLGDTVTLILRSDNLRISTKGVIQGTAAIGDMVTVQLSRYNRTFRGRLIEGRLVEVWL